MYQEEIQVGAGALGGAFLVEGMSPAWLSFLGGLWDFFINTRSCGWLLYMWRPLSDGVADSTPK